MVNLHVPRTPVRPNGTGPVLRLRPITTKAIFPLDSTTPAVAMWGSRSEAVLHRTCVVDVPINSGVKAADWVAP